MGTFVVAGSLNLDLAFEVPHLPREGEAVHAGRLRRDLGGKGFNQAAALRRLGAEVLMMGAVGADADGDQFLARLDELGIGRTGVARLPGIPTGLAVPMVDPEGANLIVVALGANLDPSVAAAPLPKGADFLLLQGELAPESNLALARAARAGGLRFMVNLAPADRALESCVEGAEVVVVNEVEAGDMGGAERLLRLGARAVVVTLGPRGAVIYGPDAQPVESPRVKAADTTGAGDAFCAALALRLGEAAPLPAAVRWACAAGAAACLKPGTSSAMPTRPEVDALLQG